VSAQEFEESGSGPRAKKGGKREGGKDFYMVSLVQNRFLLGFNKKSGREKRTIRGGHSKCLEERLKESQRKKRRKLDLLQK